MGLENYINKDKSGDPQPKKTGDLASYTGLAKDVPVGTVDTGKLTTTKLSDYEPWSPNGINSDFDINLKRAQDQGFWEGATKRVGNIIANVPLGLLEGIGYVGTLASEWGEGEKDYSNAFTEVAKKYKNIFGEVFREHPDQIVDFSDPAWYGDMFQSLAESAGSFALEGIGVAKVLGEIGDLARATKLGAAASKGIHAAEHLGTAAFLAYSEGAMSGAQIFDETYQHQYNEGLYKLGLSPQEATKRAKSIASNAAATTVQINTVLNTVLNLGELAPLFKHNSEIEEWFLKNGKKLPGETAEAWKTRLKGYGDTNSKIEALLNPRKTALASHAASAVAEGIEEVNTQFAEHRGRDEGNKGKKDNSIGNMLAGISSYLDDTVNTEGALNMALGAIGGASQTVLLDHIPMHSVQDTDAQGNPVELKKNGVQVTDSNGNPKWQTTLRSSKYRNELGNRKFFNNIRDAVVSDIDSMKELHTKLQEAIAKKDDLGAERIKSTLFNTMNLTSIQMGMGDAFKEQFADIEKLDNTTPLADAQRSQLGEINDALAKTTDENEKKALEAKRDATLDNIKKLGDTTEAMQKGFATSTKDNDYKRRAKDAQVDLEHYDKLWETTRQKYSSPEDKETQMADYVFAKKAELYQRDRIIKRAQEDLTKLREANPNPTPEEAVLHNDLSEYIKESTTESKLVEQAARVSRGATQALSSDPKIKAQGLAILREAAEKYMPVGASDEDLWEAVEKGVVPKIGEEIKRVRKNSDSVVERISASPEYADWKEQNKDGDIAKYMQHLANTKYFDENLTKREQDLSQFEAETNIARKNVQQLETTKGKLEYYKKSRNNQRRLTKILNEKIKKDNQKILAEVYTKSSANTLSAVQRKQLAANVQRKIEAIVAKIQAVEANIKQYRTELDKLLAPKGLRERLTGMASSYSIRRGIEQQEKVKANLQEQLNTLQEQMDVLTDPTLEPATAVAQAAPVTTTTVIPSTGNLEEDARKIFNNDIVFDRVMDDILSQEVSDEATMMGEAQRMMGNALKQTSHPLTQLTPEERAPQMEVLGNYLKEQIQDILKQFAPPPPVPIITAPVQQDKSLLELIREISSRDSDLGLEVYQALNLYSGQIAAGVPYSLNFLNEKGFVGDGKLSLAESAILMQQFQKENSDIIKTVDSNTAALNTTPLPTPVVEAPVVVNEVIVPPIEIAPVVTADLPSEDTDGPTDITTPGPDIKVDLNEQLLPIRHEGMKTVAGFKVNVLTHNYTQDTIVSDHGLLYINQNTYTMNEGLNPLYLTPGYIKAGSEIKLVIDEEYNGPVNDANFYQQGAPATKNDSFANYVDTKTSRLKENDIDIVNIPVKIVDARTGTTIGYLPRGEWITSQYPNRTGDYRNVVDKIYDEEGKLVKDNNVAEQANIILRARRKLVKAYNMGIKEITTTVTSRSAGVPLRVNPTLTSESILDPNVEIAILQKGSLKVSATKVHDDAAVPPYLLKTQEYGNQNVPGIIILDASGHKHFEPLWSNKISKSDIDMVARAIEVNLSLQPGAKLRPEIVDKAKEHADFIQAQTGFDITTEEGLGNFLNQYYHFPKSFNQDMIKATPESLGEDGKKRVVPNFMLDVSNGKIRAGISKINRQAVAKVDGNGQLNEAFREMLEDERTGLASKYKNIVFDNEQKGITGINSKKAFKEVTYHPNTNSVSVKEHASYNDYVKSNTRTTLYGKNQLPNNGAYVYFAHPNTQMDFKAVMDTELLQAKNAKPAITDMIDKANENKPAEKVDNNVDKMSSSEHTVITQYKKQLDQLKALGIDTKKIETELIRLFDDYKKDYIAATNDADREAVLNDLHSEIDSTLSDPILEDETKIEEEYTRKLGIPGWEFTVNSGGNSSNIVRESDGASAGKESIEQNTEALAKMIGIPEVGVDKILELMDALEETAAKSRKKYEHIGLYETFPDDKIWDDTDLPKPVLGLEITPAIKSLNDSLLAGAVNVQLSDAEIAAIEDDSTDADETFDSLPHDMTSQVVNVSGTIEGQELSLDNLIKTLNFTPVENRNGKTPLEVLDTLKKLGITTIAPNFNPFYSC